MILAVLFIAMISFLPLASCSAPVSDAAMLNPAYWTAKLSTPDTIIMPEKRIRSYNRAIQAAMPDTVADLEKYPQTLSKKQLMTLLTAASFPAEKMYNQGSPVGESFYNELRTQINVTAIKDSNPIRYGFTVVRANLRTFPTGKTVFESVNDREFDLFQETAVDPAEPVLVLHESLRKDWFYVQTGNYRGWLSASQLAIAANRREWLDYMNTSRYLVVTGNKLLVRGNGSGTSMIFEMGAKLPLEQGNSDAQKKKGYTVLLPVRNQYGKLSFERFEISRNADVRIGYLPYTQANIIQQAFKFYGQPYGWGGMHDSVDCSSLSMNVYRSFGIKLPRNADQQEVEIGKVVHLENMDYRSIEKKLLLVQPGATLHMDGHVMLYLGRDRGKVYVIHSLASYGDVNRPNDYGTLARVTVMKVVVSDLDLTRRNGKTFLESLRVAKNIVQ